MVKVKFGIPWSVSEFFAKALELGHPFQSDAVDDEVATSIFQILTGGPDWTRRKRRDWLERWRAKAEELLEEEEILLNTIDPQVAGFSRPKRPLLFHKMLIETGFPPQAADLCLEFLLRGIPMFGPFPATGIFPTRRHEATKSVAEVRKTGKAARKSLLASMRASASKECDKRVYEKTLQERDAGICAGPFTEAEITARFGEHWLLARRFGVPQKGDYRTVDDYSEYDQNATSDTWETVDTDGVDAIVAVAKCWVSSISPNGKVSIRLSTGEYLEGWLHPAFFGEQPLELLARLLDLAKAYKQLAKDPRQSELAMFAAWNPSARRAEIFDPYGCGFGPRNVVFGFNLFARALKFVLATGLMVPVTHFFDDFSHIEVAATMSDGSSAMLSLFDLVGWQYKDSPEELKAPASVYHPLGVVIDLSKVAEDFIEVGHTEAREQAVCKELGRLEAQGMVRQPEIDSLYGRLRFSDNQCLGRCGAPGLRMLKALVQGRPRSIDQEVRRMFNFWREYFRDRAPRKVYIGRRSKPVLLFTDAAADGDDFAQVGSGAVLYDPATACFEFFAAHVTERAVSAWREHGQKQVIGQGELHPIACALSTWADKLRDRDCIIFVDNNSAKDAIIRGDSSHPASRAFVDSVRTSAAALGCGMWLERVPSPSNVADWPSRGVLAPLLKAGAKRVGVVVPPELKYISEVTEM